jgi:2-methylcitrate dehydratase PrpD
MAPDSAEVRDKSLSERLADYIHDARYEDIPAAAIAKAKTIINYHVALALRWRDLPDCRQAINVARRLSGNRGDCVVIGQDFRADAMDAALANCTLMRCCGLDDVIFPAGIHAGLVTVPVALAFGPQQHRSGKDVLTALVVGYEILGKFGAWTWSAEVPRRPTMPFGPFGSIAVASRLLGLTRGQLVNAIGYGPHTAMGVAEGDTVTHYYSMVARGGMLTAILAQEGGVADRNVIEGRFGFIKSFLNQAKGDPAAMVDHLGRDYSIVTATEKRYPGTAVNIVPIEAIRDLMENEGITLDKVDRIDVHLPVERANFDAGHATGPFTSPTPTKSSVAFHIAIMLLDGGRQDPARYDQFDSPEIARVLAKIKPILVPGKAIRYARLEVFTTDGRKLVREGDDYLFPGEDQAKRMIDSNGGLLPRVQIDRFLELLDGLEKMPDVTELVDCLTLARPQ